MRTVRAIFIALLVVGLVGCKTNEPQVDSKKDESKATISQDTSTEVINLLKKKKDMKAIHVVNTKKEILVAFELEQENKLQQASVREEITKEIEDKFPKHKIHVSTDKKIILETEKLEQNLKDEKFTKKELSKKVNEIIDLSKENT